MLRSMGRIRGHGPRSKGHPGRREGLLNSQVITRWSVRDDFLRSRIE